MFRGRQSLAAAAISLGTVASLGTAQPALSQPPQPPSRDVIRALHDIEHGLSAVSADSETDAWAVGTHLLSDGRYRTRVKHFDGTEWASVTSPNPGGKFDTLMLGVVALSPSDVWAVGRYDDQGIQTLTEHWDGSAFVRVRSPGVEGAANSLSGVDAVSSADVWAVGGASQGDPTETRTLVEHWDGSAWSIVPSPNPPRSVESYLYDVSVVAPNDVWAVGVNIGSQFHTLVEHWNGRRWSIVSSPDLQGSGRLTGVDAVSADDVWAVGTNGDVTLAEHWDGTSWSLVTSPNGDGESSTFMSVSAVSSTDAWAVGRTGDVTGEGDGATLIERWNGHKWSRVQSPSPGQRNNSLRDVSAGSAGAAWAVGSSSNDREIQRKAIVRWDGDSWSLQHGAPR